MSKTTAGRFFEDFQAGETLRHATPRTLSAGDAALYAGLYGARFPLPSSDEFARRLGFNRAPIDELLAFHVVFGKTVPDISLNAIANLGYAEARFLAPVYGRDTLTAVSEVIGVKETSNRQSGVVTVRTRGFNQTGAEVLTYVRWVLVRKRDPAAPAPEPVQPVLAPAVAPDMLVIPPGISFEQYDAGLAGSRHVLEDYRAGERIDHVDGQTVEEAEHQIATRLYQNSARVHFNQHAEGQGRFGRRLVYGGHVISLARALSFNGLANAAQILAINAGTHANPLFAGNTVFAWSEVLETRPAPGRADCGFIRVRTIATKDHPCTEFPGKDDAGRYPEHVILDLDYWALMPRRAAA